MSAKQNGYCAYPYSSRSLSTYSYDISSDPTIDPPESIPAEDIGEDLHGVPDPDPDHAPEPDPDPWGSFRCGEVFVFVGRERCPPFPLPPPPPLDQGLLRDEALNSWGWRGSNSAAAASKNTAACGWLLRRAVACAEFPARSRLSILLDSRFQQVNQVVVGVDTFSVPRFVGGTTRNTSQ